MPGYKRSDVGVIPEDWDVLPLGECLVGRPSYGINAAAVPYSDALPVYIRITDISEDGRFSPDKFVSVKSKQACNYYLSDGDIVFARTGASVGKSYRYNPKDGALVFAGFLIRVRPDANKLHPAFAAAYVTTGNYWRWVRLMSMRSGQPGINGNEYSQLPIPLPLLPEQCAIAQALSDVDELLGSLEKMIAKKRDLKQASMQQLLAGGIQLAGFGGKWLEVPLGDIVKPQKGQLITTKTIVPGDIPVIAGGKQPAYFHASANRCGKTITVSASGASAGYVAFHAAPIFASDCSTISESEKYCIEFIYYALQLRQEEIYAAQTGGAQPHIQPKDLTPILIKIPEDVKEQAAIASVLSDMDAEITELEARRDKTRNIKQAMMQELLTGKTRLV